MNGYTGSEQDSSPAARLLFSSFFTSNLPSKHIPPIFELSADNISMLRSLRASGTLKRSLITAPCSVPAPHKSLGLLFVSQLGGSRHKHTHSVSKNQTSTLQVASDQRATPKAKPNAKPLKVAALKTLVETKASEARGIGCLDAALEAYLDARKVIDSKTLASVQDYLYEQLTTPTPPIRDECGEVDETYEELKERLPWPNTSSRLREAFRDDIGSETLSAEKQQAILRLYDATEQNPEPFLVYCDRLADRSLLSPEDRERTRNLVEEIIEECRDAGVMCEHLEGDIITYNWLATFTDQEWLTNPECCYGVLKMVDCDLYELLDLSEQIKRNHFARWPTP
ncbi:hypothetical protein KCU99_g223, partial [Aureobasidium melanogenum]